MPTRNPSAPKDFTFYVPNFPGADDQARMSAAVAAANANAEGGDIHLPAKTFSFTGGFVLNDDVGISGEGKNSTRINHSGNNTLFTWQHTADLGRGGARDIHVFGNSGASAHAVDVQDTSGMTFRDCEFFGYSGSSACRISNLTAGNFSEDTLFDNCSFGGLVCLELYRTLGTGSFSHTQVRGGIMHVQVANGAGIRAAGSGISGAIIYAGTFTPKIFTYATGAAGIDLPAQVDMTYNDVDILHESQNVDTVSGVKLAYASGSYASFQNNGFYAMSGFSAPSNLGHTLSDGTGRVPSRAFRLTPNHQGGFANDIASVFTGSPLTYQLTNDVGSSSYTNTRLVDFALGTTAYRYLLPADRHFPGRWFEFVRGPGATGAGVLTIADSAGVSLTTLTAASTKVRVFRENETPGWKVVT